MSNGFQNNGSCRAANKHGRECLFEGKRFISECLGRFNPHVFVAVCGIDHDLSLRFKRQIVVPSRKNKARSAIAG